MSLPKIRSVWIRSMSQNHRIIWVDVCDLARAVDSLLLIPSKHSLGLQSHTVFDDSSLLREIYP
jgi:hypothetical protein